MPFVNFVGYGVKLQKENKNRKMIISRKKFFSFSSFPACARYIVMEVRFLKVGFCKYHLLKVAGVK